MDNLLQEESHGLINRSVQRVDSVEKTLGNLKYFSDIKREGMLYGKVFRSGLAHALIKSLDVDEALRYPGVKAVLTYKDVPALNAYGAMVPEAPVLAYDRVRYYGEPIALIASNSPEASERALESIKVEYEKLPVIRTVEEALSPGSIKLHYGGNVAKHMNFEAGDVRGGFERSHLVLSRTYRTQPQKHMYLETESGIAYVDESGMLTILSGAQDPYQIRRQVARAVGYQPEKIRIINYPQGGAFGGKDDITVQIHLALLALKTGRPVKIVWDREESGAAGYHRHGSVIELRTGIDREGKLIAHEGRLYFDTGAYQSFGPSVLNVAVESICEPYRIPNVKVEAELVYTNNGFSSAFRGYGVPQSNFAMETMLNELATEIGMDPIEIRLMNLLKDGEIGVFRNTMADMSATRQALMKARESDIWGYRHRPSDYPWIKCGVGMALAYKGIGGYSAEIRSAVEVLPSHRIAILFTNVDYGQGINTSSAQIVAEKLGLPMDAIEVQHASTDSPDTGPSSSSKSTIVVGNSLLNACDVMLEKFRSYAGEYLKAEVSRLAYKVGRFYQVDRPENSISIFRLAERLRSEGISTKFEGAFFPPSPGTTIVGLEDIPRVIHISGTMVSAVEVNVMTGEFKAIAVDFYDDAGTIINPLLAVSQCEGGIIQGLGFAQAEDLKYDENGKPLNINFSTYMVPTAADIPKIHIEFMDSANAYGPYGAKGIGEISTIPVAASVVHAMHDVTGLYLRELPLSGKLNL